MVTQQCDSTTSSGTPTLSSPSLSKTIQPYAISLQSKVPKLYTATAVFSAGWEVLTSTA